MQTLSDYQGVNKNTSLQAEAPLSFLSRKIKMTFTHRVQEYRLNVMPEGEVERDSCMKSRDAVCLLKNLNSVPKGNQSGCGSSFFSPKRYQFKNRIDSLSTTIQERSLWYIVDLKTELRAFLLLLYLWVHPKRHVDSYEHANWDQNAWFIPLRDNEHHRPFHRGVFSRDIMRQQYFQIQRIQQCSNYKKQN